MESTSDIHEEEEGGDDGMMTAEVEMDAFPTAYPATATTTAVGRSAPSSASTAGATRSGGSAATSQRTASPAAFASTTAYSAYQASEALADDDDYYSDAMQQYNPYSTAFEDTATTYTAGDGYHGRILSTHPTAAAAAATEAEYYLQGGSDDYEDEYGAIYGEEDEEGGVELPDNERTKVHIGSGMGYRH